MGLPSQPFENKKNGGLAKAKTACPNCYSNLNLKNLTPREPNPAPGYRNNLVKISPRGLIPRRSSLGVAQVGSKAEKSRGRKSPWTVALKQRRMPEPICKKYSARSCVNQINPKAEDIREKTLKRK